MLFLSLSFPKNRKHRVVGKDVNVMLRRRLDTRQKTLDVRHQTEDARQKTPDERL